MLKTDIIAFFSAEHFFRLKTEEKQKEKFDLLQDEFFKEFPDYEGDYTALFLVLIDYHKEQQKARKARQLAKARIKASLPVAAGCDKATDHIKMLGKGRYVLTCAQNNTYIDETALKCLLTFCEANNARLLVARITYNKNGFAQPDINNDNDLWYDEKIKPYLVQGHISLEDKVHFLADSNVIPTAKNPLSGFDSATNAGIHVIIPHVKIALEVVAALKNSPVKIMASTGAITKRNYIMRKAGATAALSHNIGALLVDIGYQTTIRQLEVMPECDFIYDFDTVYYADGSHRKIEPGEVVALQPGDIHAEKMMEENLTAIKQLIRDLKPANLIAHDLLDFSTQNHHNAKDCTHQHKQALLGNTVENDINTMTGIIDDLLDTVICYNSKGRLVVVESNHDLALLTWLKNADFKADSINAITYLRCMLALYEHQQITCGDDLNMLEWAYKHIGEGRHHENILFNRVDESCIIAGVEMGAHGHNGANGSKGSPEQFRKLGIPMNTGHTHSPSIKGKVYTAGVSASLEMGYNIGASSWAIAHIVTFSNGQRQIIFK